MSEYCEIEKKLFDRQMEGLQETESSLEVTYRLFDHILDTGTIYPPHPFYLEEIDPQISEYDLGLIRDSLKSALNSFTDHREFLETLPERAKKAKAA